jgi:hypothetical protein
MPQFGGYLGGVRFGKKMGKFDLGNAAPCFFNRPRTRHQAARPV